MPVIETAKPPRGRRITAASVRKHLRRVGKDLYHRARFVKNRAQTVVFIVGCQRSGTTLMLEIFDRDLESRVYGESSRLSSEDADRGLRLNPLPKVERALANEKAPLVILKPLAESQNTLKLLGYFEDSKALWLFRHYRDVTASHMRKWGGWNSIRDLRAIVEMRPNNWRYENVSDQVRDVVLQHFDEDMDGHDAAALYWFVRNSLFFDLGLDRNPRVLLCRYEDLVTEPEATMAGIYEVLGHRFPGIKVIQNVYAGSVKKGRGVRLSPGIERICSKLLERLQGCTILPHHWGPRMTRK